MIQCIYILKCKRSNSLDCDSCANNTAARDYYRPRPLHPVPDYWRPRFGKWITKCTTPRFK